MFLEEQDFRETSLLLILHISEEKNVREKRHTISRR